MIAPDLLRAIEEDCDRRIQRLERMEWALQESLNRSKAMMRWLTAITVIFAIVLIGSQT